ncbi:inositol monophosphatase family protein [Sphaerochaeta sp. PS]|uniref:inositol monophosphatase family protein n=1 Tax=Sphaerochaeta sp. PS TaxID=3076336 RepID=UPI0028A335E7|nr:inositol monophosphatase family protein [Sphaerochaeta sp. PS]MDT4762853.1 inositol monophosphatase family protein [Sphaerochaeta sp. PS]
MELQLDSEKLDILAEAVRSSGLYAQEKQKEITRSYKQDGTVITETDLTISRRIIDVVQTLFPEANIISEETLTEFDEDAPCTFVLDPIDGTDVYSQGLPCWAVALGILDRNRKPVGAYIAAPRWGVGSDSLFVRLDPGKRVLLNDELFEAHGDKDIPEQITMGSSGQRLMDFSHFYGKIRIFGSSILHMLAPAIYSHIQGCINQSCYVWDITASHAVLLALGMDIEYVDGSEFVYDDDFVLRRKPFGLSFYAGTKACRAEMAKILPSR